MLLHNSSTATDFFICKTSHSMSQGWWQQKVYDDSFGLQSSEINAQMKTGMQSTLVLTSKYL